MVCLIANDIFNALLLIICIHVKGRDTEGKDKINFMEDDYQYPTHHVIAARITAENPGEGA
jgi:hypothetical protein